jgi:hypothetical protein
VPLLSIKYIKYSLFIHFFLPFFVPFFSFQGLARDYLVDPIQVNIGSLELAANKDITQHVIVCEGRAKMDK